jgi:hypothetical protein
VIDARQLARAGIGLLVCDRNVRVLGDNEGVEPALLDRRAQLSWTSGLVGDESRDPHRARYSDVAGLKPTAKMVMSMTK